jgi:LacI family transcriptional regulator
MGFTPRIAYLANVSPEAGFYERAHHRMLFEGAQKQAEEMGYRFEAVFVDEGHHDSASLYHHLKKTGTTGIIIAAFESARRTVELNWEEFCVVKVDSRHMDPPVTFVSTDQFHGVRLSLQKLRALGYQRIGLAVGLQDEEATDDMHVSGYLLETAPDEAKLSIPPLLFPRGADTDAVVPLLQSWVKEQRLDAVLCNWTNIRTMLTSAGFRVPQDLGCACLCLPKQTPSLAGIVSNMGLVGERVAALLATLMRTERRGVPALATTTYVQGIWYDGSSAPQRK